MKKRRGIALTTQLFLTDLALTVVGLAVAVWLRDRLPFGREIPGEVQIAVPVYVVAVVTWAIGLHLSGAYNAQASLRWYNETPRVVLGSLLATGTMAGILYMTYRETSRLLFAYFYGITLALLLAQRAVLRVVYRARGKSRPGWSSSVLIVGAGDLGRRVAHVVLDHSRWGYLLVGFLDDSAEKQGKVFRTVPVLGPLSSIRSVVADHAVSEVWMALPLRDHDRLAEVLSEVETLPVRVKVVPDYFSLALVRARAEILGGIPLIGLREPVIEGTARTVKRVFDIAVSLVLLVLLFPFLLALGLLIRLDSRGPVLFRQERVGENGRVFGMLKFRTMVRDAETRLAQVVEAGPNGEVIHKHPDDPRVTHVGRWLRRYSLDELPQLVNVLGGEMSLVGPRPEMPWLVDRYASWQRKRFAVPQGITGWWQINGRSDKPMHLNTDDDLYYVYNYSLWLDILILLRTPLAVLGGRGAF